MNDLLKKIIVSCFSFFKIKDKIILESHPDFSDNTKALYDYMLKQKVNQRYKIIWLVSSNNSFMQSNISNVKLIKIWDQKNKISFICKIKLFFILINARFILYSNRSVPKINKKTISVYLNHGFPVKKAKDCKCVEKNVDYILCASEASKSIFTDQLNAEYKKMLSLGVPRNDLLFVSNVRKSEIKAMLNLTAKKSLIWLPTFRSSNQGKRIDSTFNLPLGIPILYDKKQLIEMDLFLKENNIIIVLKLHPAQDVSEIENYKFKNLLLINDKMLLNNDIHLYELIGCMDGLITDYSSVYIDSLLLDLPLLFTTDDFDEYNAGKGFAFENPKDYMPGTKAKNVKEFKKFIIDFCANKDNYKKKRKEVRKFFYDYSDNKASERVFNFLELEK